jgi:hypothetical protein
MIVYHNLPLLFLSCLSVYILFIYLFIYMLTEAVHSSEHFEWYDQ